MSKTHFSWSEGNSKLLKTAKAWTARFGREARFVSFNIPQFQSEDGQKTCPYAGTCANICYAGQGRYYMPSVRKSRERNLSKLKRLSQKARKETLLLDLAQIPKTTHVRIHDSGDFYSREYYLMWVQIACDRPDLYFYTYTKSIPFLDWSIHPHNFRIVQSFGGKRDREIDTTKPHAIIFESKKARKHANYCDGDISDIPAILGQTRIGLVYHGVKNLTDEDRTRLRIFP